MNSFNILGACVSRDAANLLVEKDKIQVLQYSAFSSLLSLTSQECETVIDMDDLVKRNYKNQGFKLRCMIHDINNTALDYAFEKESDYLILDIIDARYTLLRKQNYFVTETETVRFNIDKLKEDYGFDTYERVSPFTIDDEIWTKAVDILCEKVSKHYSPRQIILHEYLGSEKIIDMSDSGEYDSIRLFHDKMLNLVRNYNALCKKLYAMIEERLSGCHIIKSLNNTVAVSDHKWGVDPGHYHNLYYEYAAEAIEIITRNLPYKQEKTELSELKASYEEKFDRLLTRVRLNEAKKKMTWRSNVIDFTYELINDLISNNKFIDSVKRYSAENSKIAILSSHLVTARILTSAFEKYSVETVFTSKKSDFNDLTEEEIEKCRQADIIISADIQDDTPIIYEDLTAVRIPELIK